MDNYYITITRQFGSLGRPIAQKLSELLNIEYFDRDIVEAASRDMGLPVSVISDEEEQAQKNNFFHMLFPLGTESQDRQDAIFDAQRVFILNKADANSCIVVGRCADYILRNKKNCINIFIYAPEEVRFENCVNILHMDPSTARKTMLEVDAARERYWQRYAHYSHSDFNHRQLMVDSSILGVDGTAKLLADIIRNYFMDRENRA